MGPMARQCQVCNEAQSKYKCPCCLILYCSLVCFKKHKVTPCVKPESTEEKKSKDVVQNLPAKRHLDVDEPSEILQKMQLESIASSAEIRDALKDEQLQKLILSIDSSSDAENELDKAMGVEAFRVFTDKILSAMGP